VRICSLVPAATEVLFALGLGDQVVGVTHECDWPPEAAAKPVVTASLIQTGDLSSAEIDRVVAETASDGRPLYAIEEERWAEVNADVVVMQELCDVCAVSTDQVEGVLRARPLDVEVLDFSPSTIEGIGETIGALGARLALPAAEVASGQDVDHGPVVAEDAARRPAEAQADTLDRRQQGIERLGAHRLGGDRDDQAVGGHDGIDVEER